ncbi:MAG: hypothetical protein KIT68_02565 [Phycisphaeraceae bacterium]|nr:hypothetical protein [Phycisphaeraceae bacterium]
MQMQCTRALLATLSLLAPAASATAQWSTDPANNFRVADRLGEQSVPKISPANDGGAYITWFDNGSTSIKADTWTWNGTAWTRAAVSGPAARYRHSIANDSTRARVVMFGGAAAAGLLADTWEWNGTTWSAVNTPGPSARQQAAMVYDAARQVVMLFGGSDGSNGLGDTWTYNGTAWTQAAPSTSPGARWSHGMAYDSVRQVVVLFGGRDGSGALGDTWEWNGTNWTQAAPAGTPGARSAHGMAFDPVSGQTVLFAGEDAGGNILQDTWLYDGSNWAAQAPATLPAARREFAMANSFTAGGQRVLIYGGFGGSFNLGNAFEWSGTNWGAKTSTPTARVGPAMAFDAARSNTVLFGGQELGFYDLYLQRLDASGNEQWPHNGVLVCDLDNTQVLGASIITAADGGAVIAHNDQTEQPFVGFGQISVSKFSAAGTRLWKRTITSNTGTNSNPVIAQLTDGTYAVGYNTSTSPQSFILQRLDADGTPLWAGTGVSVTEAGRYLAICDIKPVTGGFAVLWVRASGASPTTTTKGLAVQKFDFAGAQQWNAGAPFNVFGPSSTASIQNGYFPTMLADGSGGVCFAWYDSVIGSRNAYLQHVLANGTLKFPAPLTTTGATPGRGRLSASLSYDAPTGAYFIASSEANGATTNTDNNVVVQKIDSTGALLWGGAARAVFAFGSPQPSFVNCLSLGSDCIVAYMITSGPVTRVIRAARVNADQSIPWAVDVNNDGGTDKSRLAAALSTQGFAMLTYGWGNPSGQDIAAARLNADGTLGNPAAPTGCSPADVATEGSPQPFDDGPDGFITGTDFDVFVQAFFQEIRRPAGTGPFIADLTDGDGTGGPDGFITGSDFDFFIVKFFAGCP